MDLVGTVSDDGSFLASLIILELQQWLVEQLGSYQKLNPARRHHDNFMGHFKDIRDDFP